MESRTSALFSAILVFCMLPGLFAQTPQPAVQPLATANTLVDKGVDAKYVDFAKKLSNSLAAHDASAMSSNFDFDLFFDRMMAGRKVSDKLKNDFLGGFRKSFNLGQTISKSTNLRLLRVELDGTETRALIRSIDKTSGLIYIKLLLVEKNGKICIADCFTCSSGEDISATVGRNIIPVLAREDSGLMGKLFQKETEFTKHLDELANMTNAINQGDPDTFLQIYGGLPDSLKNEKAFLMMRIKAGMFKGADSKEYQDALATLKNNTKPGDSSVNLMLLDFYYLKKDYKKAMECVDGLSKMTGDTDPYLYLLKGNILSGDGKKEEGEASIKKALEQDPTMEDGYLALLTIQFSLKKWKDAIATIESFGKNTGKKFTFESMEREPVFAELVKSDEYRKWKESKTSGTARQPQPQAQQPQSQTQTQVQPPAESKKTSTTKKPRILEPK